MVHTEPVLDGIAPQFREVIAACLAKDPAARPTLPALSAAVVFLWQRPSSVFFNARASLNR